MIPDANSLAIEQVIQEYEPLEQSPNVRQNLQKSRQLIECDLMDDNALLIYSFNTGVGAIKNIRIALRDIKQFQTNVIYAHATGFGEPLPVDVIRAIMMLWLNAFYVDFANSIISAEVLIAA